MSFIEGKSKREKMLVIGLAVSVLISLYIITRVGGLNDELTKVEQNYKSELKKLNKLKKETGDIKPSSQIEKSVKEVEKKVEIERQNLKGFDLKFVDLSDESAVLNQITLITVAAENNQLRILSKKNELKPLMSVVGDAVTTVTTAANKKRGKRKSKKTRTANLLNSNVAQSQLQRRMFTLKLRGTFKSTYEFLKELQLFENDVLITKVSMTADDKNTYNGLRLIITDITLAI